MSYKAHGRRHLERGGLMDKAPLSSEGLGAAALPISESDMLCHSLLTLDLQEGSVEVVELRLASQMKQPRPEKYRHPTPFARHQTNTTKSGHQMKTRAWGLRHSCALCAARVVGVAYVCRAERVQSNFASLLYVFARVRMCASACLHVHVWACARVHVYA